MKLLKTFLARDRAQKAKSRLSNQSDSMHSDTEVDTVSDVSFVSNTTYSDEGETTDKKKEKKSNTHSDEGEIKVDPVKTSDESEKGSMVLSVGSMWSAGPSATDSEQFMTETVITTPMTELTTQVAEDYTTEESKGKMPEKKKLEKIKRKEHTKKKFGIKKKIIRSQLGIVSGAEADDSDRVSDGESCQ